MSRANVRVLLSLVVIAAAFAGCDSSGGSNGADATGETGSTQSELKVVLKEWAIETDQPTIHAGAVRFVVDNVGLDHHEMVVLRTDLALGDLPRNEDGELDEEGEGLESMGEIEGIMPGQVETKVFDLQPGRYLLICNVTDVDSEGHTESHFAEGMVGVIHVI
jgi:hypothetical protein